MDSHISLIPSILILHLIDLHIYSLLPTLSPQKYYIIKISSITYEISEGERDTNEVTEAEEMIPESSKLSEHKIPAIVQSLKSSFLDNPLRIFISSSSSIEIMSISLLLRVSLVTRFIVSRSSGKTPTLDDELENSAVLIVKKFGDCELLKHIRYFSDLGTWYV